MVDGCGSVSVDLPFFVFVLSLVFFTQHSVTVLYIRVHAFLVFYMSQLLISHTPRYTSAFGVYEDFYVRTYLTNFSASDIGCAYYSLTSVFDVLTTSSDGLVGRRSSLFSPPVYSVGGWWI